jgi:lycopene cyclase domain-containing protein
VTYLLMGIGLVAVAAAIAGALRKHLDARVLLWSGLVLIVMTAVFDNLIIGAGIVAYDETKITGMMVGLAPLEDFSYTIAGMLLLPAVWNLLRKKL